MAFKDSSKCLKGITALIFMALSQLPLHTEAQGNDSWAALNQLLNNNIERLGGRAVMLVSRNGKIVFSKVMNEQTTRQKLVGKRIAQMNEANKGFDAPFSLSSRQRIASCSKWLSAALVMTFVDEKKLSLEDTIGKFLPVMTAHGKGGIKVWQCLSHLTGIKQVGLGENDYIPSEAGSRPANRRIAARNKLATNGYSSMQAAMESIASQPMEGPPGKTFHYGNAGLQIAAAIIEKISGKSFNTLFVERIARPLDMRHTDFGNKPVALAAGGAFSTPEDYLHFLEMILNKGVYQGKQILSTASVAAMQQNSLIPGVKVVYSPSEAGNWGYGFGEWIAGNRNSTTDGSFVSSPGLFGSFPWIDTKKNYAAFLFVVNIDNKGRHELYQQLKSAVESGLKL